jgi:hypothetical protein
MEKSARTLIIGGVAMSMALASHLLFYTDEALNRAGMASPRGYGDTLFGSAAVRLQPWLWILGMVARSSWTLDCVEYLILGFFSGILLASMSAWFVRRWSALLWPLVAIFGAVTIGSVVYTSRNFALIEMARSQEPHEP